MALLRSLTQALRRLAEPVILLALLAPARAAADPVRVRFSRGHDARLPRAPVAQAPELQAGPARPVVSCNLAKGEVAKGHMLAFTPKPRLVKSTMCAIGEDPIIGGDACRSATRYLVDLEVGGVAGVFAKVAAKEPPDLKFWVLGGPVPVFVKFEGPFFGEGPVWRIELSAPRWPD